MPDISLILTIAGLCAISGTIGYAAAQKSVAKRKADFDHLISLLQSMSLADAQTVARNLEGH